MRIAISFVTLALIIAGGVLVWRSGQALPGVLLILIGLAINTIMATGRKWPVRRKVDR